MVSPCNAGASCGCSVMNKLIYACVAAALAVVSFGATEKVALKTGWRFVKGDEPAAGTNLTIKAMSAMLDRACVGNVSGAPVFAWAKPEFDDSSWGEVRVPHDWGVEKPFDSDRAYGDAFLDVTGIGWYRLKFRVEGGKLKVGDGEVEIPGNGCVFFECDGAMSYAMLYVNGSFAGGWPYGYTRWRVDITSLLSSDGENTLAIRCCNVADSSLVHRRRTLPQLQAAGLPRGLCPAGFCIHYNARSDGEERKSACALRDVEEWKEGLFLHGGESASLGHRRPVPLHG